MSAAAVRPVAVYDDDRAASRLYSEDAEQAVLSAMLMDQKAMLRAAELLDEAMFYAERHRWIFQSMVVLTERGSIVDPLTLSEELSSKGELEAAGGKDYIGYLVDAVPTSANVVYHAEIVRTKSVQRKLLAHFAFVHQLALEGKLAPSEMIELSATALRELVTIDHGLPAAACAWEMGEPTPIEWAIDGWWTAGDLGLLVADGGQYKSTIALHVACAGAAGGRVFGHFRAIEGPALYVSAEDPEDVVHSRARAIIRGHGWNEERVLRNLHIYGPKAGVRLSDPRWIAKLRLEIERTNAKTVVLDPLFELSDGNENEPSDQRATTRAIRSLTLAASTPIVIVVAHAGKASPGKRKIDRAVRGSSSWFGAARVVYYLDDASKDGVSIECLKMSRAVKPAPFVVKPIIDEDPANSAMWRIARLEYQTTSSAALDRAESWVLEQTANGVRLNTTELKAAAKGTSVSAVDVSRALTTLEARKLIDFAPGANGAKFWGRICLPMEARQPQQPALPGLPEGCPATTNPQASLASPFRGASRGEVGPPDLTGGHVV